jgi:NADH-quinone oxidoreductase subunit B
LVSFRVRPSGGPLNTLFTKLEDLLASGRKSSLWPYDFGTSRCFVEMVAGLTPRFDIAVGGLAPPEAA